MNVYQKISQTWAAANADARSPDPALVAEALRLEQQLRLNIERYLQPFSSGLISASEFVALITFEAERPAE
jgi:hypothetical protein